MIIHLDAQALREVDDFRAAFDAYMDSSNTASNMDTRDALILAACQVANRVSEMVRYADTDH